MHIYLKLDIIVLEFMAIDMILGVISGFLSKSIKTTNGAFSSQKFREGIAKKAVMIFYLIIAAALDYIMHTTVLHYAMGCLLIFNEGMSILEKGAILGVPMPKVLKNALEVVKGDENSDTTESGQGK